jgi:hypothetical protein
MLANRRSLCKSTAKRSRKLFLAAGTNSASPWQTVIQEAFRVDLFGSTLGEGVMVCGSCGSAKLAEFRAEMNIHLPGLRGLNMAGVWAFPKLAVCFDCGSTLLDLSPAELRLLEESTAVVKAA